MDLLFLLPTGIISYAIFLCNILNIFFKVFCALRVFYTSKSPTFLENFRNFRYKKPRKIKTFRGFDKFPYSIGIIACITPNAYFTAFFDRLSVTRLLRIFSQAFSRCFIISQLLELYMLRFSGEVKVADCSDHLLSVYNMNLFHIV